MKKMKRFTDPIVFRSFSTPGLRAGKRREERSAGVVLPGRRSQRTVPSRCNAKNNDCSRISEHRKWAKSSFLALNLKGRVLFSKVPQCREMRPARKQTSAMKQSQAISSPFDSVDLLSHPGTEIRARKLIFFSSSPGAAEFLFFFTPAVSQNSAPLSNILAPPPLPQQLLSHRLRPPQGATASTLIGANNLCAGGVPVRGLFGVERFAELVEEPGVRVEDDDVVNHHGDQHHHHLQLVVDPQKHRTRHQAQNTAVDEVLDAINKWKQSTQELKLK